ncbi:MAG: hypothetical protein ACFFB5_01580 [Promethearchaeota archaeon]
MQNISGWWPDNAHIEVHSYSYLLTGGDPTGIIKDVSPHLVDDRVGELVGNHLL